MRCGICGSMFRKEDKGFLIKGQNEKEIAVCPNCHGFIVLEGQRYDVDIMVVPVKRESFLEALEKRVYVCPANYVRKSPKLVAFYRGNPVGAITHLAKIKQVQQGVPAAKIVKEESPTDVDSDKWKKYKIYKLFHLEKMMELKNPIKRQTFPPIQTRVYVDFQTFSKAKMLRELFH